MSTFSFGQRRLRSTLLALAFIVSVLVSAPAAARAGQQAGGNDPETVARAWVQAINQGATEDAIALYADDAVIQFLGKEVVGKEAIAQRQRTTIGPMLKPSLQLLDLTVEGDIARLRLRGENAVTRWDKHDPVTNELSFTVREGKIYREVGPILSAEDTAWYADAQKRFMAARAQPTSLPKAGGSGDVEAVLGLFAIVAVGLVLLTAGAAVRQRSGH